MKAMVADKATARMMASRRLTENMELKREAVGFGVEKSVGDGVFKAGVGLACE